MNQEGYSDPTADKAVWEADKPPQEILDLVYVMRKMAGICGYDITSRIHFRDRKTGKEWQ